MVSVCNYLSYKDFIFDYYKEQKKLNFKFSYQYFANKAGFSTKTFIPKIIKGEKKLAQRSTLLMIKAMGLNKRESLYFESLVNFNNVKSVLQKELYFHRLQSLSKKSELTLNREDEFNYFSKWYHVVIYELVSYFDWKDDFKILGKAINPSISNVQAKKAVERLERLGLIKKKSSGKFTHTDLMVIDSDLKRFAVKRFHERVLELGLEALKKGYDTQDFYIITKSVSLYKLDFIKREIEKFKRKVIEIADSGSSKEKIIQLNIQLFSVSKNINK